MTRSPIPALRWASACGRAGSFEACLWLPFGRDLERFKWSRPPISRQARRAEASSFGRAPAPECYCPWILGLHAASPPTQREGAHPATNVSCPISTHSHSRHHTGVGAAGGSAPPQCSGGAARRPTKGFSTHHHCCGGSPQGARQTSIAGERRRLSGGRRKERWCTCRTARSSTPSRCPTPRRPPRAPCAGESSRVFHIIKCACSLVH